MVIRFFERIYMQIKGMRVMFFVPLIGYFALIPILSWVLSGSTGFDINTRLSDVCYLVVPFLSTWWIYMVLKEYVEGDGREVLALGKNILPDIFFYSMMNIICALFILLIPTEDQVNFYLFIEMIIVAFFMGGLTFFLISFFRNITIAMMLIIFYSAASNYTSYNEYVGHFLESIRITLMQYSMDGFLPHIKFIVVGTIFWMIGGLRARKFK